MENEIFKELKFVEKIIVKLFAKTFYRVYNLTRIKIINMLFKKEYYPKITQISNDNN